MHPLVSKVLSFIILKSTSGLEFAARQVIIYSIYFIDRKSRKITGIDRFIGFYFVLLKALPGIWAAPPVQVP